MRRIGIKVVAMAAVGVIAVACGTATKGAKTASPATIVATGSGAQGAGTVPPPLQDIEGAAEAIIDVVPTKDWLQVLNETGAIERNWRRYRPAAVDDGVPDGVLTAFEAALAHLKAAATVHHDQETMQASNDLSAATVELFGLYNPVVPVDIGRLDVVGRQVVLDVSSHDLAAASNSVGQMRTIWEGIRKSVIDNDGLDVARQMDATVASLENALDVQNAEALTVQAKIELEVVDAMEGLY